MSINVCMFVWSFRGFFVFFLVPFENFSLIWIRYHYQWRATRFDQCTALITIEQWGFFSVPHLLWHETSVHTVISEDPWLSHLLSSVWQFRCHYLFYRITIVATGDQTPISCINDQSSSNLATYAAQKTKEILCFVLLNTKSNIYWNKFVYTEHL